MRADNPVAYRFGDCVLDLQRMSLMRDHVDLNLRPKAFDVLRLLVEHAGTVVGKSELLDRVWSGVTVNDEALTQCIRDIRKVLGVGHENVIRTVPRRGYLFVADVVPVSSIRRSHSPRPRRLWWMPLAVVGLLVAIWLLAPLAMRSPTPGKLAIAVLPFESAPPDADQDWLAEGLSEDVLIAVSRFRDLTVIARNSSFRYRNADDPRLIGEALGADFLLDGSIRLDGKALRLTAELVDAATGEARWTRRYDTEFDDVLAVRDQLVDSVAAELVVHAKEAHVARLRERPPGGLEVYELTLRARKAYRAFTREGNAEALGLARRAIAADPHNAAAWEVVASCLLQVFYQPYDARAGSREVLIEARAAAERAMSLDASFSTAHAIFAAVLLPLGEYDQSLAAAERAIDLNPSDPIAHSVHGNVLTFLARYEESIAAWERTARIDPFLPPLNLALTASPHLMMGNFERSLELARSCADRAPNLLPCHVYVAASAAALGLDVEARAAVAAVLLLKPDFDSSIYPAVLSHRDPEEATRLVGMMRAAGFPG